MAVNNEIKVGQKWKTYMGRTVTVERKTDTGFLVIDEAGSTYAVNERGQSDATGFQAVDLESRVAESETVESPNVLDLNTPTGRASLRKFLAEPVLPVELTLRGADVQLDGMHVTFAGDEPLVDADELASETLSALGWVFDGQCWVQSSAMPTSDDITAHPLYAVFMKAIEQAMFGKGERHGGARTPFLDQPWVHYVKMHGRGFATGQAAKKLEEAASTRSGEAFETEVLGAIVYSGMAILKERGVV